MSLITITGSNPFEGQSDPYLSIDSSLPASEATLFETSYKLNGVITGCSYNDLAAKRDAIANAFDWKRNQSITGDIQISGVIGAGGAHAIIPQSISFEASNYLGSLNYDISLQVFTGYDGDLNANNIINKVHTETVNINEKGCVSVSTSVSCEPNSNLAGCGGIDAVNEWIQERLTQNKLGYTSRQRALPLQNESVTINPITSAVQYQKAEGEDCGNILNAGAPGGSPYQLTHCTEEAIDNLSCPDDSRVVTVTHKGEIYGSGKSDGELMAELNSQLLYTYDGISAFSATYVAQADKITYGFVTEEDGNGNPVYRPKDLVLNNYKVSFTTDHDKGGESASVGGDVIVVNPIKKTKTAINSYPLSDTKLKAQSLVGSSLPLSSQSNTRDTDAGTLSYSYNFNSEVPDPNDGISLDGFSGVSTYSVSVNPPMQEYTAIPNLNCDDLIFKDTTVTRGLIAISLNATSGSGYDFEVEARKCKDYLLNTFTQNRLQSVVEEDSEKLVNDNEAIEIRYSISYKGASAIDENDITSMT